jgi:hypothetical protein
MSVHDDLVCEACAHTVFTVQCGRYHCCRCGTSIGDVPTLSASLQQLENAFEPRRIGRKQ